MWSFAHFRRSIPFHIPHLITMFAAKQSIKTVASNARAFSTTPARRSYDDTIKNLLIG